jgi:hypothetical protein
MLGKVICVASHRRSGTHLTIDQVRANFKKSGNLYSLDKVRKEHHSGERPKLGKTEDYDIVKTHMLPSDDIYEIKEGYKKKTQKILGEMKTIYVARNGMDVMVSLYEYMKSFDEKVESMRFSDFIKSEHPFEDIKMNRVEFWSHHVREWIDKREKNDLCVVRFEDWESEFEGTIEKISDHIDVKTNILKRDMYKGNKNEHTLRKLFGKVAANFIWPESTAIRFRRGKSGERFRYFDSKDVEFFVANAGDTLERLGYCIPDPESY